MKRKIIVIIYSTSQKNSLKTRIFLYENLSQLIFK